MLLLQEAGSTTSTQGFSTNELIGWSIAAIAALIAILRLLWMVFHDQRSHSQTERQIEQQKPASDLAREQKIQMSEDKKPKLEIAAVRNNRNDRLYRITNIGGSTARNIDIEISPNIIDLRTPGAQDLLPIDQLPPNGSIDLLYIMPTSRTAQKGGSSDSIFEGELNCEDENGKSLKPFHFRVQN